MSVSVGDVLEERVRGHARRVRVTKVGRRWATYVSDAGHGYESRFDITSRGVDGGSGFAAAGHVFSEEDWAAYDRLEHLRSYLTKRRVTIGFGEPLSERPIHERLAFYEELAAVVDRHLGPKT